MAIKSVTALSVAKDVSALHIIDQLTAPALLLIDNKLERANAALLELLSLEQIDQLLANSRLHHVRAEALLVNRSITLDIKDAGATFHCTVSPVAGSRNETIILFEDISLEAQGERNNALLYRVSLILAASEQPLQERLQLTVDQLLLELSIFDSTIFLFDETDGYLKPIAWATNDLKSKAISRGEMRIGEGISGLVAQIRRPIVVPDMAKDKRVARPRETDLALSLLSVPMVANGRSIGVLSTTRVKEEPFSDRDLQLFNTIANRLASLVENFRKDEEEDLQNEIVGLLSTAQDLAQQCPAIMQTIARLLRVNRVQLLEFDNATGELDLLCATDTRTLHPTRRSFLLSQLQKKKNILTLNKGQYIVIDDQQEAHSATLVFPLSVKQQSDHLLLVQNTLWSRTFTDHEITMGTTASTQLVVAMKSAQFHGEALSERKKLQQIQNTLQDGLILYTPELTIDSYNNAARRILGIKKDITGLEWHEAMDAHMDHYCRYRLLRQFDPKEAFSKVVNQRKGMTALGTVTSSPPKTLEISIVPVFDTNNELSGILSHFRDITPMYELQNKMAIRVKQLTNLFKISSVTGFDVQNIVRKILTLILRLLSVRACQLLLVNSDDDKLYIVESLGDKQLLDRIDIRVARKVEKVSKTLLPVAMGVKQPDGTVVQTLVVPVLGHHNACIGALLVADKEDGSAFTREDTNMLSIVAARIAMKIDNARLVKQVESDREKMAAIIEQSADGILVIDAERRIQLWNTALERITGIGVEEVKGQLTDDIELTLGSPQNTTSEEGATEIQIENRKTGKKIWIGTTYAPIVNSGEVTGYVAIIRDISRRKELEQAKNEFVSTASHELRSPITAIVGYLSMLKAGDAGPITNPSQEKFIDKAYQNSKRMVDLIEDLLMTTRMETGQLRYQYEPIDLFKIVEGVVADTEMRAKEKDLTLELENKIIPSVCADHDAVHQILINIVTNAIKYTPQQGKIAIKFLEQNKQGNSMVTVAVKDSGVGIDPEDQSKVFDKFTRVDNPLSVSAGGTGLGLYITKMIVEQLGGKIWVRSKKGSGSTFFVSLPVYKEKKKGNK